MSMKEPGQITYEAMFAGPNECAFSWRDTAPEVRSRYARVEAAILATKPGQVAGIWVVDRNRENRKTYLLPAFQVAMAVFPDHCEIDWAARWFHCSCGEGRKFVEALGGEWMEEAK